MSRELIAVFSLALSLVGTSVAQNCAGKAEAGLGGVKTAWILDGGGIAAFSKMNINFDGYAKAYHPKNYAAGAILHLCNAGRVYLPDGSNYQGSESGATCTGKFMDDYARIEKAGWMDPSVGAINWYGVVAEGTATIHGKTIRSVKPAFQQDDSGFFVSPSSLMDPNIKDLKNQSKYVNPLRIPSAVIPGSLISRKIAMGSFGVAINVKKDIAVPFVVGDGGPRIGEGSAALARMVAGFPASDNINRGNRGVGQVDSPDVLWVFFGGQAATYDHTKESKLIEGAKQAYKNWGGDQRLHQCILQVPK